MQKYEYIMELKLFEMFSHCSADSSVLRRYSRKSWGCDSRYEDVDTPGQCGA